jgi:hypothetical protein
MCAPCDGDVCVACEGGVCVACDLAIEGSGVEGEGEEGEEDWKGLIESTSWRGGSLVSLRVLGVLGETGRTLTQFWPYLQKIK